MPKNLTFLNQIFTILASLSLRIFTYAPNAPFTLNGLANISNSWIIIIVRQFGCEAEKVKAIVIAWTWFNSCPGGGGAIRPLPRDRGVKELHGDSTVGPHPKVWTIRQNERSRAKGGTPETELAQALTLLLSIFGKNITNFAQNWRGRQLTAVEVVATARHVTNLPHHVAAHQEH